MSSENIKILKRNFSVYQGYFYTFDHDQDNLLQKTDDGNTAFSYPLDVLLANDADDEVVSTEFDGIYFWTMQNFASAEEGNIAIKRWKIDNYICKLQQTISGVAGGGHTYDTDAFSVAHYHDTLSASLAVSGTELYLTTYGESTLMDFTTTAGVGLTLHLGPNSNGEEEDVEVHVTISGGGATISGSDGIGEAQYAYAEDDPVNFYTYLWLFNNFDGNDSNTGALYKWDAYTGEYLTKYTGGAYKDVNAATFYKVDSFTEYGNVDTLAYVKGTNTLFVNDTTTPPTFYGSMVMTNIQSNQTTVIPVYDLSMDDQNVYRLQVTGDDSAWAGTGGAYSYELSSLDSFVTSISLAAYPAIIAANAVSTSDISAIVKDQFLQPIVGRLVYVTDDGDGIIIGSPNGTDSDGLAQVTYRAGTAAQEVTITAVVAQS